MTTLPPVIVEGAPITSERTRSEEEARQELERIPGGVALVGAEEIQQSRAANLKDVLDFVPGVLIRPRFGAADESQLSVRGSGLRNNFHLRGINILLDGFPYGNADGFSDFESLELLSTKRIEVYKGANALRFGANSLGGAINLVTKTGYDNEELELRSEGGSFGFHKTQVATGQEYGPFDVYFGLTNTELDGFRDHSEQARRRVYSSLGYRFDGGTTLRLDLNYVRNEEDLPGALTRAELRRDATEANPGFVATDSARDYHYTRTALTWRTPLAEDQVLEWFSQFNYQDLDHPLPFAVIDNVTENWGTEARYTIAAPLLGHGNQITLGAQYAGARQVDVNLQNNMGTRGAKAKDQINRATNVGFYAEEQFDVTETFALVAGGRVQYAYRAVDDHFGSNGDSSDSEDFISFTPKVGFVWRVLPTLQVFGNASRTYEPPLLLELTAPGQIGGDLSLLNAQKAWQFEVGTRGTWGPRLEWDLAVFDIELWDEIQNVNVQPFPDAPFTIPRFQNIDRSRHTGVEVGAEVRLVESLSRWLGIGSAGDTLRLRTAYTWSHFVFVGDNNFDDNDLPGAPRHFIRSELRYEHPSGFWIAPGVEAVPERYFVNSENDASTDTYALFSLRMAYEYKPLRLTLFFEARNLTDETYASAVQVDSADRRFFEPGDGRAFYGGVAWKW
ncbi:MAG: TonB-dependent receptor family protein [Candidatus Binatia bacterium]